MPAVIRFYWIGLAKIAARVELAWLLATCADESIRDGKRAVKLAESVIEWAGGRSARALEVLDAARREAARSAQRRDEPR